MIFSFFAGEGPCTSIPVRSLFFSKFDYDLSCFVDITKLRFKFLSNVAVEEFKSLIVLFLQQHSCFCFKIHFRFDSSDNFYKI